MDKDEFDKKYHKLNDQLRELEVQNHQQGKSRVEYSIDELKRLIESGKIHNELGGWYIKWIEEQNRQCPKWQKFFKSNKNLPEEDRMKLFYGLPRELSSEETLSRYEEAVKLGQMHNLLLVDVGTDNVNRVERPVGLGQKNQLFKHADPEDNFGICYALANATFYLLDLLEVKPIKSYGDNWTATGRANDSYGRSISLVYDFQASSTAEAEKILEKYKKIMVTKGILVWLAYWMVANKMGRPEYTCPYIDIMKCTIGKNRTSRFESKERQRHWGITKMLQRTKIKIERFKRTDKKGNTISRWVEQPMVEILGGEERETASDKYPLTVSARVLSQQFGGGKGYAPTFYKNNMLSLEPNDILLAFIIQTRYGQHKDSNGLDWDRLIKLGNLESTAKSNRREAKAKIRQKMKRFENAGIVESTKEDKFGIRTTIKPFKTKTPS